MEKKKGRYKVRKIDRTRRERERDGKWREMERGIKREKEREMYNSGMLMIESWLVSATREKERRRERD